MKKTLNYIAGRMRERSSWLGLITLVTGLGLSVSPEEAEVIISAGTSLAGLILFLTRDPKNIEAKGDTVVVKSDAVNQQTITANSASIVEPLTPELDAVVRRAEVTLDA